MSILKTLLRKIHLRRDPAGYWRKQGARIGTNSEIYPTANFGSEPYLITIGDHVRINGGVQLITHDGGVWVLRELYPELQLADLFGPIVIGNNVHVGTNVTIMPGVTIGSNCVIGCNAVVTKNIPDNSVVVGIPGRVIKTVEEYKEKNLCRIDMTKGMCPAEKRTYLTQKFSLNADT